MGHFHLTGRCIFKIKKKKGEAGEMTQQLKTLVLAEDHTVALDHA